TLTPQDALEELKRQDTTGVVSKLLEAQQAQLQRLQDPLGEETAPTYTMTTPSVPSAEHPMPATNSMKFFDTNSARERLAASGRGVLIDSQGRRFEVASAPSPRPRAGLASRPPENPSKALGGDSLPGTSLQRAYGLLLGVAAAAFLLVLWIRRRFKA
ncbi:MAG: hypothetical protein AAB576_02965, partial [Elusimicrobiota bacterium]